MAVPGAAVDVEAQAQAPPGGDALAAAAAGGRSPAAAASAGAAGVPEERRVTFQEAAPRASSGDVVLPEPSAVASTPSQAADGGSTGVAASELHVPRQETTRRSITRRVISAWRLPMRPGEMPLHVQRDFRTKTYGLLSLQLAVVVTIMFGVHWLISEHAAEIHKSPVGALCFYMLGFLSVFLLLVLRLAADVYPWNYGGLAVVTLVVGVCWGLAPPNMFGAAMHWQVLFILLVTMIGNTLLSPVIVREKVEPWTSVVSSNLLSWATGAAIDIAVVTRLGGPIQWAFVAALIALLLIFLALAFGAGALMVSCNPDCFLHVVITMDCCLLVVTAPVFIFASFLFCTYPLDEEAAAEGQAPAEVPAMVL